MDRLLSERARPYFEKAQKLAPIIREHADRAEREAQMPREVIDAFHDAGLLRILLPRQMGGGELTIPDSLRLCEEEYLTAQIPPLSPIDAWLVRFFDARELR